MASYHVHILGGEAEVTTFLNHGLTGPNGLLAQMKNREKYPELMPSLVMIDQRQRGIDIIEDVLRKTDGLLSAIVITEVEYKIIEQTINDLDSDRDQIDDWINNM